jgi:hypothetical protein
MEAQQTMKFIDEDRDRYSRCECGTMGGFKRDLEHHERVVRTLGILLKNILCPDGLMIFGENG